MKNTRKIIELFLDDIPSVIQDYNFTEDDFSKCEIEFVFYESSSTREPYIIDNTIMSIVYQNPIGIWGNDKLEIIDRNRALVTLGGWAIDISGNVKAMVQGYDSNGRLSFGDFKFKVKKDFGPTQIEETDKFSLLTKLINDINSIIIDENKRLENESIRIENEKIRIINEKDRVDSEELRKKDYEELRKVIIDENQAANLQDQINKNTSQLDENVKFINKPTRFGEIILPSDFDSKGIKLFRNVDGKVIHNINFDLIENQSFDKILYFDTENGNETTGDGTQGKPYKTLRKCLEFITTSSLTKFKILGKGILLRNEVNAPQPATIVGKTIVIISNNDDKSKISVSNSDGNHRTTGDNLEPYPQTSWTLENGIYKTTKGAVVNCYDKKVRNVFGAVEPMKYVTTATDCKNTPHSWTIVGGVTYVNTYDARVPDKDILVCRTITSTGLVVQNSTIYFKDFEFFTGDGVGGFDPYAKFDSGIIIKGDVNSKAYFVNCNATTGNATTVASTGGGVRGFKTVDMGETYVINCICPQSSNDNFSYTSNQVVDTDKKKLFVFEYNNIGFNSGTNNTGDNNQISTQHNGSNILRVNCNYWASGGQVIADTGGVYSILIDVKAENSRIGKGAWNDTSYWFDNGNIFDNRIGKVYMINCTGESGAYAINSLNDIDVFIDKFPNYKKIGVNVRVKEI